MAGEEELSSGEQLAADSSFSFSPQTVAAAGAGTGGTAGTGLAFWGQGAIASFSGRGTPSPWMGT
ncbi:hypothetical protein [Candidatus Synechococcus spongiarum]|uniref:hypothetical protein n=1 Tax=Candidatus Synechococcus spongiarum TaxID=431041 RepID=UPI00046F7C29|nr:hypothetical protein [Candidatus Synechococcus spongiarum]